MAEDRIIKINIEDEMKTAYIDYSMSVIVSRAIPDVRDGLKPVHRRVLYGMQDLGLQPNKSHKKSARIVGEVLGKYHPHGDGSVYDAMVRLAQEWSMRYMMVDGQGNYGSMDGDPPAAMRYTEARLRQYSTEMLADIDKETVDFKLNFDDTLEEPTVLPSKIPNLLVNGASGIAVGMATNMLPHNLTEAIDGCIAYVDNPEIDIAGLMQYVKAPDFPTGGIIYGYDGIRQAFETGRGRVILRSKCDIEDNNGKERIVVSEVPYQINKAMMIKKIADLVNEKRIDGISAITDLSDRRGLRIVIDIKRDANATIVLNKLYQLSQLQTSYGINNIALVKGRPKLLNLRDIISNFIEFRHEVVVRRTEYELRQAEKRAHILEGLIIAVDNLDEVIKIIRSSATPDIAREGLISRFELSDIQAKAILDMRLQQLTGLQIDKLRNEYEELMKHITHLKAILADKQMRMDIIKEELLGIKEKFGDERRSEIDFSGGSIDIEDLIPNEQVVVTISHLGYVKRSSLEDYKVQGRGGKGSRGVTTRDEDFTEYIFVPKTHNYLLIFTEMGRCYWMRVYQIPEGSKTSKGRAIQNLISLPKEDNIKAFITIPDLKDEEFLNNNYVVFCTKKGIIKKTLLEQFSRPRVNGVNAITIKEGDQLLEVKLTNGNCEIIIAKKSGKAIRFNEQKVRSMGRTAAGVKGVKLESETDEAIGMVCIDANDTERTVMVLSEKGYGKRSVLDEYRMTNRGGKGVKTLSVTEKTGNLIGIKDVTVEDHLLIINKSGLTIRLTVDRVNLQGRATQGVRLIKLNENDEIAGIAKFEYIESEEIEVELDEDGNEIIVDDAVEDESVDEAVEDDLAGEETEDEETEGDEEA